MGLQHAANRRGDLLIGLLARRTGAGEQLGRPSLCVGKQQPLFVELEQFLLYESGTLVERPALIAVALEVVRQAAAVTLQQQAHRARLADGGYPLARPREAVVDVSQLRAGPVEPLLGGVQLIHQRLPPRGQPVVDVGQRQQHLSRPLRRFLCQGNAELDRL